ncbi:hypothetical protein THAOC_18838, partial [Thalassiosira oceanica]
ARGRLVHRRERREGGPGAPGAAEAGARGDGGPAQSRLDVPRHVPEEVAVVRREERPVRPGDSGERRRRREAGSHPSPPAHGGGPSWPSLGDFPPPPGGTGGKPRRQQAAKPAGSWGKPVQAKKKSAWGA